MSTEKISLNFEDRLASIRSSNFVLIHTGCGAINAEYVNGSECRIQDRWRYDFLISDDDIPSEYYDDCGAVSILDVEDHIVFPFVTSYEGSVTDSGDISYDLTLSDPSLISYDSSIPNDFVSKTSIIDVNSEFCTVRSISNTHQGIITAVVMLERI